MKKYKCYFYDSSKNQKLLVAKIEAENQQQAYKIYIAEVDDILNYDVYVDSVGFFSGEDLRFSAHRKKFDNNIQKENAKNQSKPNIDAKTQDLDIKYQESGWAEFFKFCGGLNLIFFVIGGIWLINSESSDRYVPMNLMLIGLFSAINCFFFAFLVNTFTRIQHNTHLTTLELIKLNKKNDSVN
mgnify:FL=1